MSDTNQCPECGRGPVGWHRPGCDCPDRLIPPPMSDHNIHPVDAVTPDKQHGDAARWVPDEAVQAALTDSGMFDAPGEIATAAVITILEAAAPHIRAAVLLEAADFIDLPRREESTDTFILRRMAGDTRLSMATESDGPGQPDTDDFYVDDEPVDEVIAAFRAGQKRKTAPPQGHTLTIRVPHPAEAAVARVRALHWKQYASGKWICNACGEPWPCPTSRTLDGGDA